MLSHRSKQDSGLAQISIPFLAFPAEIRNLIYRWTFILSRRRPEEYNIPDFVIHGDYQKWDYLVGRSTRGGIRWMNVEKLPLLLASKRIFIEALPVISAESYMEIKIYTTDHERTREKQVLSAYSTLLRCRALCQNVRKIALNITPTDWHLDLRVDSQLRDIYNVIKDYPKLKELALTMRPSSMFMPESIFGNARTNSTTIANIWGELQGFFMMANKKAQGVSLSVELLDYAFDEEDNPEDVEEIKREREMAEKIIDELTKTWCGMGADVWVEWNITENNKNYY